MIDWDAEQSDKFIGTAAAIASLIAAGAGAGASAYASHKQGEAANATADAAKYGADKQDAAAQRAEAFQRQEAENAWQNAQQTQQSNYNQQKARYGMISQLGGQFGLPSMTMPDYVPGIDPHYTDGGSPPPGTISGGPPSSGAPSGPSSAPSGIDWTQSGPQLAQRLSAYFKSKGVADSEVPYWVAKAPELVARGQELKDPEYANKRLAAANIFGGGAGTVAGSRATAPMTAPSPYTPIAPLTGIPTPYQPGTIAARRSF